jgi:hypothetical protein
VRLSWGCSTSGRLFENPRLQLDLFEQIHARLSNRMPPKRKRDIVDEAGPSSNSHGANPPEAGVPGHAQTKKKTRTIKASDVSNAPSASTKSKEAKELAEAQEWQHIQLDGENDVRSRVERAMGRYILIYDHIGRLPYLVRRIYSSGSKLLNGFQATTAMRYGARSASSKRLPAGRWDLHTMSPWPH